jgi:RimJ/RimL family protein N-acetyltransferase
MSHGTSLRYVQESDLEVFFKQQLDPEATQMAAFPARDHQSFMTHWENGIGEETTILQTIVFRGEVVGNIVCWEQSDECNVGYWLGREYWGKGIASAALSLFLTHIEKRPLYAHVAKHNAASIRVLQKCGFANVREGKYSGLDGGEGEELIMMIV